MFLLSSLSVFFFFHLFVLLLQWKWHKNSYAAHIIWLWLCAILSEWYSCLCDWLYFYNTNPNHIHVFFFFFFFNSIRKHFKMSINLLVKPTVSNMQNTTYLYCAVHGMIFSLYFIFCRHVYFNTLIQIIWFRSIVRGEYPKQHWYFTLKSRYLIQILFKLSKKIDFNSVLCRCSKITMPGFLFKEFYL